LIALRLGDFAALDAFSQISFDLFKATRDGRFVNVAQDNLKSGGSCNLRDAVAHRAGPEHTNRVNRGLRDSELFFFRVCVH